MTISSLTRIVYQHRYKLALLVIIALGAFLRLYHLGEKSLWQDEALFWQWADGLSLDDFLQGRHYSLNVYILILSALNSISMDEGVLRLISATSGMFSIPVFYLFARRFVSNEATLAGALFLALAPNQVSQSQQLREYSLTVLLTSLIIFFFFLYVKERRIRDWVFFTFFSLVGIYAQVGLLLILAALGLTSLFLMMSEVKYRQKNLFYGLGIYAVLVMLAGLFLWRFAYAQYLGFAAEGYLAQGYWDLNLSSLFSFIWKNSWLTVSYAFNSKTELLAMFLLTWGAVVWIKKFRENALVLSLTLMPILLAIIAGMLRVYPYAGSRHTIFLSISLYLLVAAGLNELFQYRAWLFGLAVALIGIYLFQSSWLVVTKEGHEEMRPIAELLCAEVNQGDHIYIQTEAIFAFDYYWRKCHLSQNENQWFFDSEQLNMAVFYSGQSLTEANLTEGDLWFVSSHLNEGELNRFLRGVAQELGQRPSIYSEAPGAGLYLLAGE